MSDNDFGSLTEFFNSLVGALNNPEEDPELAELIEQALDEDAEQTVSGAAPSPGRGNRQSTQEKQPANLGVHLLAAVGKAEAVSGGEADDGRDHTDQRRGDKGDRATLPPSNNVANNGATTRQASRSPLFAGDRRQAHQAGQRVAAELIQAIAKVA